jgi:hypothetical protein
VLTVRFLLTSRHRPVESVLVVLTPNLRVSFLLVNVVVSSAPVVVPSLPVLVVVPSANPVTLSNPFVYAIWATLGVLS